MMTILQVAGQSLQFKAAGRCHQMGCHDAVVRHFNLLEVWGSV